MERVLIKFTKTKGAKFISHLDMLRTLHRALRRAQVPISYSQGFNPHASISVASPLSLGLASLAEYADIEIDEHVEAIHLVNRLNSELPEGIRVIDALSIKKKMPSAMGIVEGAKYNIWMKCTINREQIDEIVGSILSKDSIEVMKRTKSGEKMTNIRPLIDSIRFIESREGKANIECILFTGSRGSLNPDIIADLLRDYSNSGLGGFAQIERVEIYALSDGKWVDLLSYYSGK